MTARTNSQPHTLCAQGRKNGRGPEWRLFLYISTFSLIKGLKDGPLRLVMYSMANGPQALRGAGERERLSFHFEEPIISNTVFIVAELRCLAAGQSWHQL